VSAARRRPATEEVAFKPVDNGRLAALCGPLDANLRQIETALDFNYTPYVVAGFLFICLTVPMARLTDWYARKQGFHGTGGLM